MTDRNLIALMAAILHEPRYGCTVDLAVEEARKIFLRASMLADQEISAMLYRAELAREKESVSSVEGATNDD